MASQVVALQTSYFILFKGTLTKLHNKFLLDAVICCVFEEENYATRILPIGSLRAEKTSILKRSETLMKRGKLETFAAYKYDLMEMHCYQTKWPPSLRNPVVIV